MRKILTLLLALCLLAPACAPAEEDPRKVQYADAVILMVDGDYAGALALFTALGDYDMSREYAAQCAAEAAAPVTVLIEEGRYSEAFRLACTITGIPDEYCLAWGDACDAAGEPGYACLFNRLSHDPEVLAREARRFDGRLVIYESSYGSYVFGVRSDGRVLAEGELIQWGKEITAGRKQITKVKDAAKICHLFSSDTLRYINLKGELMGYQGGRWTRLSPRDVKVRQHLDGSSDDLMLLEDGTLAYLGKNKRHDWEQKMLSSVTDAVWMAPAITFFLRTDGTLYTSNESTTFSNAIQWQGVIDMAGNNSVLLALTSEGKVLRDGAAYAYNDALQWQDITALSSNSGYYIAGIDRTGHVHLAEQDEASRKETAGWEEIVFVTSSAQFPAYVGLKADGSLVFANVDKDDLDLNKLSGWNLFH